MVRASATRAEWETAMEVQAATYDISCDISVRLHTGKSKNLEGLYLDSPCRSIYLRVATLVDWPQFMVLHAGREIPNSDLKIGETSLGKIRPTFIFHVRPTHSLGNGEASEDHDEDDDEDDDDGSKRGADKGINDRGGVGKGGGAAGGGAASGGGMGGNGGSSSAEGGRAGNSGGGAFGVLISRIKVRSTVGRGPRVHDQQHVARNHWVRAVREHRGALRHVRGCHRSVTFRS